MAANIYEQIDNTLFGHLKAMSLPSGVQIAWPNVVFKGGKKTYLEVQSFRNQPEDVVVKEDAEPIRRGILQISVHGPSKEGSSKTALLAGQVADHFKRGTRLSMGALQIRIMQTPSVAGELQEDSRSITPVSVAWSVYPS